VADSPPYPSYSPNSVIPMGGGALVVPQVSDPSFTPPVIPRVDNSSGLPRPPSGLHPSVSPPAVFTEVGSLPPRQPTSEPAPNIHGVGRAAALLGHVFGRDRGSEFG
jgi:hypothetical protein